MRIVCSNLDCASYSPLRKALLTLLESSKKVEDDFAQVETEHCDVINQLVMAKIEKEETEAELVRFKLL